MIFRLLFYASLAGIAAGCFIAFEMARRRPLKLFARNLLIFLIVFEAVAGIAHIVALSDRMPAFWDWFFDLQYEFNLGSIFSSLQLMVIALVALLAGLLTPALRLWQRLYWLLLAFVFVFLSVDEFYSIHETLGSRNMTEAWRIPYAMGGLVLFAASALAFWFGFRKQLRLFILLFTGLVIMAIAGIGVEDFVLHGFAEGNANADWMYVFEEVFEMVGATIILSGFLSYMQENVTDRRWTVGKRLVALGGAAYLAVMLFTWLGLPALEARLARPLGVKYDGGLELLAYQITPQEEVQPGGEIALTMYWRANEALAEDYSLSVHVLSHPDIGSVAQSDDLHIGAIPSGAWFPHVVMRQTTYINLPDTLPAPASYWLMVRPWYGPWPLGRPWEDTTGVPIADTGSAQAFADDAVIVAHVSVPGDDAPPAPTASTFNFASEGFTLSGYDLPAADGDTLPVAFWWQTQRSIDRSLTQFFHLVPQGGGETVAFDQQPFGGAFPTEDWPVGMQAVDRWQLSLGTLAPGVYEVYTGIYDVATMERMPVTDANGQSVQDNAIHLGTLDYAPKP